MDRGFAAIIALRSAFFSPSGATISNWQTEDKRMDGRTGARGSSIFVNGLAL
jgi:hypothetical protein